MTMKDKSLKMALDMLGIAKDRVKRHEHMADYYSKVVDEESEKADEARASYDNFRNFIIEEFGVEEDFDEQL